MYIKNKRKGDHLDENLSLTSFMERNITKMTLRTYKLKTRIRTVNSKVKVTIKQTIYIGFGLLHLFGYWLNSYTMTQDIFDFCSYCNLI